MEMLVKVCATTCIFVSFPITNTYFLIAKRSLLLEYPTYIHIYIYIYIYICMCVCVYVYYIASEGNA
jgi:hypothetical protein